jgi:mono/diheme cytochrome c family protein
LSPARNTAVRRVLAGIGACLALGMPGIVSPQGVDPTRSAEAFESSILPVLRGTCGQCHNDTRASGGLNVGDLGTRDSVVRHREEWEQILRRVRDGEMPPPGAARPSDPELEAFVDTIRDALERADAGAPPDPGRVTARRLNRSEYTNTIRDLLGVDFRAENYFPTDDSGDGFDNIGEVLTVSTVLMESYMSAAERIARWAISTDLPPEPLVEEYRSREGRIRRVDPGTIEAFHRVEYAGEYTVRIGLPGERAPDAKPVTLNLWMDGELLASRQIETRPSGLVYFNPYSEEEMQVYLPEGDHVFRAGFTGDDFVSTLAPEEVYDDRKNKFLNSIIFIGPFPSTVEKESRKKVLVCDPAAGGACVERILSTLARRAYRRPVTPEDTASLLRFVEMARADGHSTERGIQLAIQAMLVSPHFLFRLERDPDPEDASAVHPVSEIELASRLSYFLWSSMPDDELLGLAEAGRLRELETLRRQIARMLADPRAAALASNFAGQWLEIRNLDVVEPDPEKFPQWDPELREAMKAETTLFFEHVLREDRPVSEFLDADYTFLNERLADFYGIEGIEGDKFRRVGLSPAQREQRGGILSQASVLTVSSYPNRTSPVIRGKYVLSNVLGTPPAPPPPDVPVLDETAAGTTGSMRQQLEAHRTNPTCASCHSRMDPLGFGLENYDAIGRWRTTDGEFRVDAEGTLPNGQTFSSPAEMRSVLASQLEGFSRTLTEKMLTYALGRGLRSYDRPAVAAIEDALASDGYRFQALVHAIVESLPFQSRRGEDVGETTQ